MGKNNDLWPPGSYRPLRVVAHMAGPIAMLPDEALPLDAILEFAAFRLGWPPVLRPVVQHGQKRYLPRQEQEPSNFVIPIKRYGHKDDPDWYWLASWAHFACGFEVDRTHWNRKFDGSRQVGQHLDFGSRRGTINVTAGRYKSYHMPMSLLIVPCVEWYCFGSAQGIALLLQQITHLGKKRSQGYGEVLRWDILPTRDDWSCWRDGTLTRCLPDADALPAHFERGTHPIRPPYWHHMTRRPCVLPSPRTTS